MSTISGISFAAPAIPVHHGLLDVEKNSSVTRLLAERPIPAYPALRLSQILKLIENGSAEVISVLEWLSVFRDRLEIDEPAECQRACALLWQAISDDERVCRIALFCAAHYIEGQQDKFPQQLIDTLDIAQPLLNGMHLKRICWLIALRDKNFDTCIRMSNQVNASPFEYHTHLSLPSTQQHRSEYVGRILPFIDGGNIQNQLPWLTSCLKQMTRSEKVTFCDQMLVDYQRIITPMVTWLKAHCLPDSNDTIWFDLDGHSRSILKKHFKMSSYYSLQSLIDNICEKGTANLLGLSERDVKQLKSRSLFWSNYSENFNQTRLLIPYKTAAVTSWDKTLEVIKLPDTLEENSEVCIFDIGDRILVEVLRGDASELRIFESTSRNKKRLLHDNDLTLRSIRQMACTCIHDHVALWQHFCEQVLRTQHQIYPNSGLLRFKGISKRGATYSVKTGLPVPEDSMFLERLKQLDSWNNAFWGREAKIKGRDLLTALNIAWQELEQAKLAKLQNNRENYISLLKVAANKGNAEAQYLYGVYQINLPSTYSSNKIQAEKLIVQSAKSGYVPAVELATKFNLSLDVENKIRGNELSKLQDRLIKKTQGTNLVHDSALDSYPQFVKKSNSSVTITTQNKLAKKNLLKGELSDADYENNPNTLPPVNVPSIEPVSKIYELEKHSNLEEKKALKLSTAVMQKIRVDHERPYINLRIDELEEVSSVYADFVGIVKTLLIELNSRKSTTRVMNLINFLKDKS
jgi:hypothetical protein